MVDDSKLISDLQGADIDARFNAWRAVGGANPAIISQLAKIAASNDPGTAKAGREALSTLTHSVGKDTSNPKRAGVVKGLLDIAAGSGDLGVRVHAIRLLSNIAGEDSVPAIARLLTVPDLREEAVFIHWSEFLGRALDKALLAVYPGAADDFKPRILAALGHRKTAAAADLVAQACASQNKDIALAAIKAFGRIGTSTNPLPKPLDASTLTVFQGYEQDDAGLRYAEAQIAAGNPKEALRVYKVLLGLEPEHLQCAAVIGLAKVGTPDAVALIMPMMKSANSKVRITAQNAWKSIASSA